jgi:hypothetical protein
MTFLREEVHARVSISKAGIDGNSSGWISAPNHLARFDLQQVCKPGEEFPVRQGWILGKCNLLKT